MVKAAYTELFNLHGDTAWELPFGSLISFFRNTDQTSDVVGRRQASTFQALAGLAGHGEAPSPPKPKQAKEPKAKTTKSNQGKAEPPVVPAAVPPAGNGTQRDVGLTVRIEVNLPPAADQETYDRIFRSIRENLLNAK
jgi:hypothetical protein